MADERGNNVSAIPATIGGGERIIRGLYHKMQYDKDKKKPNSNFYALRKDEKGVSVIRHDFAPITLCKAHCKKYQSFPQRQYVGFALVYAENINIAKSDEFFAKVEPVPIDELPQHAEIFYFYSNEMAIYTKEKGVEMPPALRHVIRQITDATTFYEDPNPEGGGWTGGELT